MSAQRNAVLTCCLLLAFATNPAAAHARHHHYHHRWFHHRHVLAQFAAPLWIYHTPLPCNSRDDCDRKDYDESGTRGRMGLGASPFHPEGPGNATD